MDRRIAYPVALVSLSVHDRFTLEPITAAVRVAGAISEVLMLDDATAGDAETALRERLLPMAISLLQRQRPQWLQMPEPSLAKWHLPEPSQLQKL